MKNKDLFKLKRILLHYSNIESKEFAVAVYKNMEQIDLIINAIIEIYTKSKNRKDIDKILESECTIQFVKINYKDLPEKITAKDIKILSFMIDN